MNKILKIFFLICIIVFGGCATKNLTKQNGVLFTMVSPDFKFSDAGFIKTSNKSTELQIYSSGVNILKISIKDKICYNGVCKDEIEFNRNFLKMPYYKGFFAEILGKKPIYNGRDLVKTDCGFDQNLSNITYQICDNKVYFKNQKGVKIVIKEIN